MNGGPVEGVIKSIHHVFLFVNVVSKNPRMMNMVKNIEAVKCEDKMAGTKKMNHPMY